MEGGYKRELQEREYSNIRGNTVTKREESKGGREKDKGKGEEGRR